MAKQREDETLFRKKSTPTFVYSCYPFQAQFSFFVLTFVSVFIGRLIRFDSLLQEPRLFLVSSENINNSRKPTILQSKHQPTADDFCFDFTYFSVVFACR
jgi:hypothetical protein